MTRTVHLDVVTDLTAVTFIRCLKRFAGRSLPRMFLSNNGKTFKPAATFVKNVFQDTTVKEHLAGQGSEWKFNLEKAPWWGGAFERLIKSTKRCLRKMTGRSRLSLDELQTLLVEVESILNSRPILYVSAGEVEEPLTPSHLLMGRRILSLPDNLTAIADPDDSEFNTLLSSTELETRLKQLSESLNYFWSRWRDEYLAELRESHRLNHRNSASRPSISKGDIVVIHDEDTPRGLAMWRRCLLEETVTLEEHQFDFPQDVGFCITRCDCTPWCCLQRIPLTIMLETRSAQKCKHVTQSIHHRNHKTQTPSTMNRQRTLPLPGTPGEKQQLEPTIKSKQ